MVPAGLSDRYLFMSRNIGKDLPGHCSVVLKPSAGGEDAEYDVLKKIVWIHAAAITLAESVKLTQGGQYLYNLGGAVVAQAGIHILELGGPSETECGHESPLALVVGILGNEYI